MKYLSQLNSKNTLAMDLFTASVEDLEIVFCFLDFQDAKEEPMNAQYLVTDLLVSKHAPSPNYYKL